MTFGDIVEANKGLKTLPVKGKDYVMVHERVKAFRKLCPEGTIETNIEHLENGMVICKTAVRDGDRLLATGLAYEREDASAVNRGSFIENCETSSIGRALGLIGLGIDVGIASAEEMLTAVGDEVISKTKAKALLEKCNKDGINLAKLAELCHVNDISEMTEKLHSNIINNWEKVKETCK